MVNTNSIFYKVAEAIKNAFVRFDTSDTNPVKNLRSVTQAQYDAISSKDQNTLYVINNSTRSIFSLTTVSASSYTQSSSFTHFNYDCSVNSITVTLLATNQHFGVKYHKLTLQGSTNSVTINPPSGATIDGQNSLSLSNLYDSIGIYSDGTNYFTL